jgi:hypothetical protein
MSEWWTYRLSDFLLFSPDTYYRLFDLYNAAIWPGQILAIVGGVATLILLRRRGTLPGRLLAAILALAWLFVAWAYLYVRYTTINWAAPYFAIGFAVQAVLLILSGAVFGRMSFRSTSSRGWLVGFGMCVFAVFVQPVIGPLLGRGWTQMEIFGLSPDPTVACTLGAVLAADRPRWELLVLPLLWCAITGATLWAMAAPDAWLMPLLAVAAIVVLALVQAGQRTDAFARPGHFRRAVRNIE